MASLVASVILVFARPPTLPGGPAGRIGCYSHHRPEATPLAGWAAADERRRAFQAFRDGCQQGGGFERLLQARDAPSFIAMVRKSGLGIRRDRFAGDHDDRNSRFPLMHQPHRLEPIHARHEDVEKQQVEIAGLEQGDALLSVAGGDHAMAGPLQQKADGGLHRCIVIHDQYSCQLPNSPADLWKGSTASSEFCRNLALLQQPRWSVGCVKTLIKCMLSACCQADARAIGQAA